MKLKILMECPPLKEAVDNFVVEYKANECSMEQDAVDARDDETKVADAIAELNKLLKECLAVIEGFDLEDPTPEFLEKEFGKCGEELISIVEAIVAVTPYDIKTITVAPDLANILIEV